VNLADARVVLQKTDAEYIVTWIMFPMSIFVLVIGRFAAKYENRPFMVSRTNLSAASTPTVSLPQVGIGSIASNRVGTLG
jgi:hypothetical protein